MDTLGLTLGAYTTEMRNQQVGNRQQELVDLRKAEGARQEEQFGWDREAQVAKVQRAQEFEKMRGQYAELGNLLGDLSNPANQRRVVELGQEYGQNLRVVNGKLFNIHDAPDGKRQIEPIANQTLMSAAGEMLANKIAALSPETFMNRENTLHTRTRQAGRDTRDDFVTDRTFNEGVRTGDRSYGLQRDQFDWTKTKDRAAMANDAARTRAYSANAARNAGPKVTPEQRQKLLELSAAYQNAPPKSEEQRKAAGALRLWKKDVDSANGKVSTLEELLAGAQQGLPDPMVKMKSVGANGDEYEYTVPMSVADTVKYAAYMALQGGDGGLGRVPTKAEEAAKRAKAQQEAQQQRQGLATELGVTAPPRITNTIFGVENALGTAPPAVGEPPVVATEQIEATLQAAMANDTQAIEQIRQWLDPQGGLPYRQRDALRRLVTGE